MSTRESVIIGGVDYTATDAEARAIMLHLADQGVTEDLVARTSYRVLVNMILLAQRQLQLAGRKGSGDRIKTGMTFAEYMPDLEDEDDA